MPLPHILPSEPSELNILIRPSATFERHTSITPSPPIPKCLSERFSAKALGVIYHTVKAVEVLHSRLPQPCILVKCRVVFSRRILFISTISVLALVVLAPDGGSDSVCSIDRSQAGNIPLRLSFFLS